MAPRSKHYPRADQYAPVDRKVLLFDALEEEKDWSHIEQETTIEISSVNISHIHVKYMRGNIAKIGILLLVLVFLSFVGHRTTHSPSHTPPASTSIDFDLDGAFEGLATLCNKTVWVEDRTIWCSPIPGGFANIRSGILNCIRYTIESGSNLVEPTIRQRDTELIIGMDRFYDVDYFRTTLKKHCPQIKLIKEEDLRPSYEWDREDFPDPYWIKDVYKDAGGSRIPGQPSWNEETKSFRQDFDKVMKGRTTPRNVSGIIVPVVYRLKWPLYFEWPVAVDPPEFWTNFGRILKFREEDIALASEVYTAIVEQHGPVYFGAHLRSEYDIVNNMDFTRPETQISAYIQMCRDRGLSSMYAAAGDQLSLDILEKAAEEHNITVVTKYHLMSPNSLSQLLARTFDQQAMVDYLVLLKSDFFAGVAMSSFSADIAVRRHLLASTTTTFDPDRPDGESLLLDQHWGGRFGLTIYP